MTRLVTLASNTAWSIAKFRIGLIQALQEHGVRVVALAVPDGSAESLPCEFLPIRVNRSGTNPVEDLRLLRDLQGIYSRLCPAAALHFTSKLNIFGAVAAHRLRVPNIGNITGLGTGFLGGGLVAWIQQELYRYSLRRADRVFFQNIDDYTLFTRRGLVEAARSRVVPGSGIDLEVFAPRPGPNHDRFVFLLVGRLLRIKGVVEYVEAARMLRAAGIEAEFRIVGFLDEGNPSAISGKELQRWIKAGLIDYRGAREDVREEIAGADCVVLPSHGGEGTPHTLLEAAAMARPVIASDVPGCRQAIEDGETGFLCRPRDDADLADRMRRMLGASAAELRRMGQRGRAKMEMEYDERIVVGAYVDALRDFGVVNA